MVILSKILLFLKLMFLQMVIWLLFCLTAYTKVKTVKLSYNGDKLTSVDERTLSSFDNAEAVNSIKDISVLPLNEGKNVNSFEGGTGFWLTNEWWAANFFYGNQVGVNGVVQGSSEQACEGSRSLKISYLETTSIDEGKKNDQMQIMYAKAHYSPTIPVGNYKFSFNIYITSDSNNNIKSKNFWFYYGTDGNASTKIADSLSIKPEASG